jgi:hypothetical protein
MTAAEALGITNKNKKGLEFALSVIKSMAINGYNWARVSKKDYPSETFDKLKELGYSIEEEFDTIKITWE